MRKNGLKFKNEKFSLVLPGKLNQIGLSRLAKGQFFQAFPPCIGVFSVMNNCQDKRFLLSQIAQICLQVLHILASS